VTDFLFDFKRTHQGQHLGHLAKVACRDGVAAMHWWDRPWGSGAVLDEPLADGHNVIQRGDLAVAWVGDLVTEMTDARIDALMGCAAAVRQAAAARDVPAAAYRGLRDFNGAYAIFLADEKGICVITDRTASVRVYAGYAATGQLLTLGTHSDLVAAATAEALDIDDASIAEFLSQGGVTFPHTMHRNVRQLDPASAHVVVPGEGGFQVRSISYWEPPRELCGRYDERELAQELRETLVQAVRDRCKGGRIAVCLSGGLDSRFIMAAIPKSTECIGVTFCDELNREARVAKQVAACYGRQWFPLYRDREHLAHIIEPAVRRIGCEGVFWHAHAVGLEEEIGRFQATSILTGINMDTYFKGYCARDMVRVPRFGGMLPAVYRHNGVDPVVIADPFWPAVLRENLFAEMHVRRGALAARFSDPSRGSKAEWMDLYPVLYGLASWPVERRLLRVKLPVLDNRLIEFAFKCPMGLKFDGRIFNEAARDVYGAGLKIQNANNGVRPYSRHWSRIVQRVVRRSQDRTMAILQKLGREPRIEHSWHDYDRCWRESSKLSQMREQYGAGLNDLNGIVFRQDAGELLEAGQMSWQPRFRLMQLAVWLSIVGKHARMPLRRQEKTVVVESPCEDSPSRRRSQGRRISGVDLSV